MSKLFGEGLTVPNSAVAYPGGGVSLAGPQGALDIGNKAIQSAGAPTNLSIDNGVPTVTANPNLSLLPKITQPSFKQASSDSAGNVSQINKTETPLGKLLHILRGGLQGGSDAIAGGALDAPRQGQSPFSTGFGASMQLPILRRQQAQQQEQQALQTQAQRQQLQMYPLQLQKTQADIGHLKALALQEDAASKRQPKAPTLNSTEAAFQYYVSQGMNPAQANAKVLEDAQAVKPEKSPTEQPIERQLADIDTQIRKAQGGTLSAGKASFADNSQVNELLARRHDLLNAFIATHPKTTSTTASDNRLDKSYALNSGQLDKVSKPIEDAVGRFGRLQDTLNQNTPQADALVAPELLTVMAGGQGSGLRMNEAEISRVVGGRSNLESIKSALNKWQTDPTKALSITPAQRTQIRALMNDVQSKLLSKQQIADDARQALINADSVESHRRIVADARTKMSKIDEGQQSTIVKPPPGAKVRDYSTIQ